MKVLLTGAGGQLGRCFQDRVPTEWNLLALDSAGLDITDANAVRTCVEMFQPDVIVNAAAYTAVDKAESDNEQAFAVNAKGTLYLAQAAELVGARLFHVSTDYVFDGNQETPYRETDTPNPTSVYGMSKLAGELLAFANCSRTTVLRTAWVFSEYGENFVKTMLKVGATRDMLNVVADQWGCPTYAGDIASAIIYLIQQEEIPAGLYHYCGDERTNWCEFAKVIFDVAGRYDEKYKCVKVNAITSKEYPTPVKRPKQSGLNCKKLKSLITDAKEPQAVDFVICCVMKKKI